MLNVPAPHKLKYGVILTCSEFLGVDKAMEIHTPNIDN